MPPRDVVLQQFGSLKKILCYCFLKKEYEFVRQSALLVRLLDANHVSDTQFIESTSSTTNSTSNQVKRLFKFRERILIDKNNKKQQIESGVAKVRARIVSLRDALDPTAAANGKVSFRSFCCCCV